MFWSETRKTQDAGTTPAEVIDLGFRIRCRQLPVDHAWPLCEAIHRHLPWLVHEAFAGIHLIHGAQSGNGWYRPDDTGYLVLSRRTRLNLRIPARRREDAKLLSGKRIMVGDCQATLGEASLKALTPSSTVYSRHVKSSPAISEAAFLDSLAEAMKAIGVTPRKMLCGKLHAFASPDGPVHARSVMVAALRLDESVLLQQHGVGELRAFGLGLFLPHKGIDAVFEAAPKS